MRSQPLSSIRTFLPFFGLAAMAGLPTPGHTAGLNVADLLGQVGTIVQQAGAGTVPLRGGSQMPGQSGLDWMVDYPRSQLRKNYFNPYDRTVIPLSLPPVGSTSSRYSVPVEGRVSMRQYRHERDDSPLLIQRHYDALLAQQGFERVIVCSTPCPGNGGASHWMKMLDPSQSVDYFYFPDAPIVLIGYKSNAVIFVAVGKNPNLPYASFIKLVEGTITDRAALDRWLASLNPVAIPTPATPARVASQSAAVDGSYPSQPPARAVPQDAYVDRTQAPSRTSAQKTTGDDKATPPAEATVSNVEIVPASDFSARLARQKGVVVVQFTSNDRGCTFCVSGNPRFDTVAQVHSGSAHFWRLTWEPWRTAFDDPVAVMYGITGLPTFITFKDGKPVRRQNGTAGASEMSVQLLQGVTTK